MEQLTPAYLPTTHLQFATPIVLLCFHQRLQHKTWNFLLKVAAFQVGVEGLNIFPSPKPHAQVNSSNSRDYSSTSEFQARLKHSTWNTKAAGGISHLKTPPAVVAREGDEKRDILLPISQGGR